MRVGLNHITYKVVYMNSSKRAYRIVSVITTQSRDFNNRIESVADALYSILFNEKDTRKVDSLEDEKSSQSSQLHQSIH